ncbi:MAG: hypothetical protein GXO78_04860 [Calditrichaeota bacterium]|nr:hypothetical protein [Calditrichota bacterium]
MSDPVRPQEVGFFDTGGYAMDVHVSNSYVYVADGSNGRWFEWSSYYRCE